MLHRLRRFRLLQHPANSDCHSPPLHRLTVHVGDATVRASRRRATDPEIRFAHSGSVALRGSLADVSGGSGTFGAWMMISPPAAVAAQMNATLPRWFQLFIGVAEVLAGIGLTRQIT